MNRLNVSLVGESGVGVEELQLAGVVRIHEHRQHLAPEQARRRTLTCTRKLEREEIHRVPSSEALHLARSYARADDG